MKRNSLSSVNLGTVFLAVLLLAVSAGFSSSKASQESVVSEANSEQQ